MPIVMLRDGRACMWNPTIDLICSRCREPLEMLPETLERVNWVYEFADPDPVARGEYWYLHKRCSGIERLFDVSWGMHPMEWVLGQDRLLNRICGNLQKYLRKTMPVGVYDQLYGQWQPALRHGKGRLIQETPEPAPKKISKTEKATRTKPIIVKPRKPPSSPRKPSWKTRRFAIMQRDGFRCVLCGASARDDETVRLHVDHIIARSRGGTNDDDNLWTLCDDCNLGKRTQSL